MPKVAVLKTKPETVLQDYNKLMNLANYKKVLPKNKPLVLKLNLSWSLYYPACSTEPWQLEGVLKTLTKDGYKEIYPVENRTVVTDVWKGAKGNKWLPILEKYKQKYYPLTETKWVKYKPKHEMMAMDEIFHNKIYVPEMFLGKNVMHLPTMKCVHPDTQILLENGGLIKIRDLFDDTQNEKNTILTNDLDMVSRSKKRLYTLNKNGVVTKENAIMFWKTPVKDNLIRVETKTGKTVKVSKEHPFLTPNGWIKAKNLNADDRIAIPRNIKIKRKSQGLPKIKELNHKKIDINRLSIKKLKKFPQEFQRNIIKEYLSGKTTTRIADKTLLSYQTIVYILKRNDIDIRWRKIWPKTPEKTSKEFWRWMGYFLGEGHAYNCKGSIRFEWTNENKKIVKDYVEIAKKLFGIQIKKYNNLGKIKYYFDSNAMGGFFKKLCLPIKMNAYNKRLPGLIFKCPKSEIYSFLGAYLDCDGSVAQDGLHVTTASEELSTQVHMLLQNLGITSFKNETYNIATNGVMAQKQLYYSISVYGDELTKLSKHIKFNCGNKQKNMEFLVKRRKYSKYPSNWDTIPVNPQIFRKVREGLGFTQESTGKPSGVNSIENGYSLPTRNIIKYFIKIFKHKDKKNKFKKELEYLEFLTSEDIAWDYISEIEEIEPDTPFLYDLTVKNTNNFIGNGIVLHNTHGHTTITGAMKNAFGGLITMKRHHCHKDIHKILVDLLAIQKEIHPKQFAVMDGTVAGDGAGPRTMDIKIKNYILASEDQVAIDAISAKMMGFDPMKIGFIKMAHDKGLGIGDPKQIDIVGEDISRVNFKFHTKKSLVIFMDQTLRKKYPIIEPILFHTPLFKMCIMGSEYYHDKFWYPFIGKKKINEFMKTEWGQKFRSYQ